MLKYFFFSLLIYSTLCSSAQILNPKEIKPDVDYENVHVKKILSEQNSSTFIIWVRKSVKAHYHAQHTEVISVLAGKGLMTVNGEEMKIKKGDIVLIPQGTVHSVITTSRRPLKVMSTQSPEFKGKDRIYIDK